MLRDVRVVDRTAGIAGPYCTKVLADAWADVVKVEPDGGDPLRARGSGALFEFLNASKRSIAASSVADGELEAVADVLVVDGPVDRDELWARNPRLVIVTITPFGCTGPYADRPATEFTLQAAAGSTGHRGLPDREPLAVGGRLGEWITGTYAAAGALAALHAVRGGAPGEHVDVAMLDCMTVTMATMPSVFASFLGWPPQPGTGRTLEVPSIEPTADGYVVFTTNSAQQYQDFCVMIDRADFLDDRSLARPHVRFLRRDEFEAAVHAFTTARSSADVLDAAALFRIPSGPVLNGATVPEFPQFVDRGVYETAPSGRNPQPRVPFRIGGAPSRPFEPAPRVGEHTDAIEWQPRAVGVDTKRDNPGPLAGLRVIDCTAWWAGPVASHALACLGADVIKVESITRPDGLRFTSIKSPKTDLWWEWSALSQSANTGKRAMTLDLTKPEGLAIFERLIATADVLIENFTPRVMDQFGLGWDRVHEVNPDVVMVRMPAFGLSGPWRDHTGFAQTMECVAGIAWLTGFPDGPPTLVRGACDPLAGMHAVIATMLALAERERTGEGCMVEATMVEAALNAAAEQVVEFATTGALMTRAGNRGPDALPQGLYPCAGDDEWVAIAVETDDQWRALVALMQLSDLERRRDAHDAIDAAVQTWTRTRGAADVADALAAVGVPAEVVIAARDVVFNEQLRHRGLFEVGHHPVTGDHELPGLPFRMSRVDSWVRGPSPTIGEHNDEILRELGLDDADLAKLAETGIIGTRPVGL
jgi:crotonobetainyl-CoA:carnitine CoA-transferase CaiB-like acyl-CoA transferase